MPQPRNDDAHDRHLYVRARLVEHEEIIAEALGQLHAAQHLLPAIEARELPEPRATERNLALRPHIGVPAQRKRLVSVVVRFLIWAAPHLVDGEKLIELSHRAQCRNPRIEMCAGCDLDALLPLFLPMGDGDNGRNAEIARDIKRPDAAAARSKFGSQVADVTVADLIEIDFRNPQAVVPPDRIGVPLDEFEKALKNRFLNCIAGGASVRNQR